MPAKTPVRIYALPFFFLALAAVGCHPKENRAQTGENESSGGVSTYTPSGEEENRIRDNVSRGLLGDSTMFPFVYQGEGKSLIFQAYTMSFTLTPEPGLVAMLNHVVPWVKPEANNDFNGIFATYVRNGRPLSLEEPYIQVQYISKKLPYCSTIDSIYQWLDSRFLVNRDAEVIQAYSSMDIPEGLPTKVKSYQTGTSQQMAVKTKWVANAYVDYNKEFWVAFGLTTLNEDDYTLTMPLFDKLVKSFRKY